MQVCLNCFILFFQKFALDGAIAAEHLLPNLLSTSLQMALSEPIIQNDNFIASGLHSVFITYHVMVPPRFVVWLPLSLLPVRPLLSVNSISLMNLPPHSRKATLSNLPPHSRKATPSNATISQGSARCGSRV
jgi:hypothetical protein